MESKRRGASENFTQAMPARAKDVRSAQQIAMPVSLPSFAVALLVAVGVVPATLPVACLLAAVLVGLNVAGWAMSVAAFDPERLITR